MNTSEVDNSYDYEMDYDDGDTRNRRGEDEEVKYFRHSYNVTELIRIEKLKTKRENQRNQNSNKTHIEECNKYEIVDKSKKRKIKEISEEDENYGNNYEPIVRKTKKTKKPKKDRIRF